MVSRLSAVERAAQFSPFAALTGYEAAVEEAARLTDEQREMTEDMKATIKSSMVNNFFMSAPYEIIPKSYLFRRDSPLWLNFEPPVTVPERVLNSY